MTIKELMKIFTEKLASGEWDENDKVWIMDDTGGFLDEVCLIYKDCDGDILITV